MFSAAAKSRVRRSPVRSAADHVATIQSAHAARRAPAGGLPVQAKLMIGARGDRLEREADETAARVMNLPDEQVGALAQPASEGRPTAAPQDEAAAAEPETLASASRDGPLHTRSMRPGGVRGHYKQPIELISPMTTSAEGTMSAAEQSPSRAAEDETALAQADEMEASAQAEETAEPDTETAAPQAEELQASRAVEEETAAAQTAEAEASAQREETAAPDTETAAEQAEEPQASRAEEEETAAAQADEAEASAQPEETAAIGTETAAQQAEEPQASRAEEQETAVAQTDKAEASTQPEETAPPETETAAPQAEEPQTSCAAEEESTAAEIAAPQAGEALVSRQAEDGGEGEGEGEAEPDEAFFEEAGAEAEGESAAARRKEEDSPADTAGNVATEATPDFEAEVRASRGGGRPLPPAIRSDMENRFGADFSAIRIHTDGQANRLSKQIGAKAFTLGRDIYFASGQFDPQSRQGRTLLAHELTHTIQQGAGIRRQAKAAARVSPTGAKVQGGWLADKINKFARNLPGYTLITVLIGYNPILGEKVERTPINLVGGLLGMVPGGALLFDRLKESGALQEAFVWLSAEYRKLNLSWQGIKDLISQAWDEMSLIRGFDYNLNVIKRVFGPTVRRIIDFGKAIGSKILEFIFTGVLKLVGAPVEKVMGLLRKAGGVLAKIFSDPIQFVKNLALGLKLGLQQFLKNIKKHLLAGLIGWITGALSGAGLTLPKTFDLKGVLNLVLQILGLTYAAIRAKLVKRIGEKTVSRMEKVFGFIKRLIIEGPMAMWEQLKQRLADLKKTVMEGIRNWVIKTVVFEGVTWLLGLLNPAGALIKVIKTFWNIIKFFLDRWQQIVAFATAAFDAIGAIAAGNLKQMATAVETALARTIPVIISFLANLLGLGGISDTIRNIIKKIRAPVDRAVGKVLDWIIAKARSIIAKAKQKAKDAVKKLLSWFKQKEEFKTDKGETHRLGFKGSPKTPKLVIASDPKDVASFMAETRKKIDEAGKDDPDAKAAALAKFNAANERRKAVNAEVERAKGRAKNAKPGAQQVKEIESLRALAKEIRELLNLIQKDEGGALGAETEFVQWGGLSGGGFGTAMEAYVTLKGPAGSEPGISNEAWDVLKTRAKGGGGYYVRGHLLNHNIHGTGNDWKNLSPITGKANKDHNAKVEERVKQAVFAGRMIHYRVEAGTLKGGPNASLIKAIQDDSKADPATKKAREAIVEAEQYLPTKFICTAVEVDPETKEPAKKKSGGPAPLRIEGEAIDNTIEERAPEDYKVKGGRMPELEHLNLMRPFPERFASEPGSQRARDAALRGYSQLPGIGKARAPTLLESRHQLKTKDAAISAGGNLAFVTETMVEKWDSSGPSFSFGDGATTKWTPEY